MMQRKKQQQYLSGIIKNDQCSEEQQIFFLVKCTLMRLLETVILHLVIFFLQSVDFL